MSKSIRRMKQVGARGTWRIIRGYLSDISLSGWFNLIVGCITIGGSIAAIYTAFAGGQSDPYRYLYSAFVFVVIVLILTWTVLILREAWWFRRSCYAEALPAIHDAQHCLRDAWHTLQRTNDPEISSEDVQRALKSLAYAFSIITGSHCRACIKLVVLPTKKGGALEGAIDSDDEALLNKIREEIYLVDFCRSESVARPYKKESKDRLINNTDFISLWDKPSLRYWHGPDLVQMFKDNAYLNSHWTAEIIVNGEQQYESALIWPIRKVSASGITHLIRGYLCVDSLTTHIFRPRYDMHVGAGFADALFPYVGAVIPLLFRGAPSKSPPAEEIQG